LLREQVQKGARREHGDLLLEREKVLVAGHESRAVRRCKRDQIVIIRVA